MNKTAVIAVSAVVMAVIVVVGIWMATISNNPVAETTPNNNQQTTETEAETETTPTDETPVAEMASVTIEDQAFTPATITVKKGTTVTWTNQDGVGHNVVSDDN